MYNIDNTFFVGDIHIPNLNEPNSNDDFDVYLEKGCYLFLYNLLGAKLFNDLKNNLDSEMNLKSDAEQKWKDLFFGCEYDNKYFEGLIQEHSTFKESVLAQYVFLYWLKDNKDIFSGIGSVIVNGKNATNVNPSDRFNTVWNNVVSKVGVIRYIHHLANISYCHHTRFIDYLDNYNDDFISIRQFLKDNTDKYPNAPIKAPEGEVYEYKTWLI